MSVLTTSQLTFCDLKDSYNIHIDAEYIGVTCSSNGLAVDQKDITVEYYVSVGTMRVGAKCDVEELPSGVGVVSLTQSSESSNGRIVFRVAKNANLGNDFTSSAKITFTTLDSEEFTFEKYVTFVKSIAGTDGTDSVNFQIYSVDGFEFSDSLTSITLKTAAFQGGNIINSGASYQWMRWNDELTQEDKYEEISDATLSTLSVSINDDYALSSIKCVMKYDGITYEDYISLTHTTAVYTAMAKFFNGSNVITADEEYLIVYIELYKNNNPEELLYVNDVWISDANTLSNNIVSTDVDGEYKNGDLMYFVCKNILDGITEYNTVLCKYSSSKWQVVESNYTYRNDLYGNTTSPVVFIPKEKITRSLAINFEVYNNGHAVARTNTMVLDFNDPTISNTEPMAPRDGQLWLDTSQSPSILKMWNGSEWVNSGYQNGNVVYTSKPENGYSKGDLWILDSETSKQFIDDDGNEKFGEGAMLRANESSDKFSLDHWFDVDAEATEQKKNIRQYFIFNADTGLKIGQRDDKFYVNISSTEMGFYDASYGAAKKVVSISNQSATIRNLTVEEGAKFNCAIEFGGFILKTETNESLSLALAT